MIDPNMTTLAQDAETVGESQCANCGKSASDAAQCISEYPDEGEWFCSQLCFEQHNILECPHLTHSGHRHPAEAARLIAAESALRSLASMFCGEGFNGDDASVAELEQRIRNGIYQLRNGQSSAAGKRVACRGPVFWVRPRSDGGYEGPIHDDQIEDVRKRSGAWLALGLTDDAGGDRPQQTVTDSMVEHALEAFNEYPCPENSSIARSSNADQMKAAICAALTAVPLKDLPGIIITSEIQDA